MVQATLAMAPKLIGYSLEDHIDVVPFDSSEEAMLHNQTRMNQALDAMRPDGSFKFKNRRTGPLLYPIVPSGKTFYFKPPLKTVDRICGSIVGFPGQSYEMLDPFFTPSTSSFGGMRPRFVFVNDEGESEPCLRNRGSCFAIEGIDIYGRQMSTWDSNGSKAVAGIQVEGRSSIATGRLTVRDCGIYETTYGIQTVAGYYDSNGVFQDEESHSDLGWVVNTNFFNVQSLFRSENQQSIGWKFQTVLIEVVGNNPTVNSVAFDIKKGGALEVYGVRLNHGNIAVLQLEQYSPNQASFDIHGVYWDQSPIPSQSNYLSLVKTVNPGYAGPYDWLDWRVRMSGLIGDPDKTRYDYTKLLDIAATSTIDTSDWLFDFKNLPMDNFELVGSGPFVRAA